MAQRRKNFTSDPTTAIRAAEAWCEYPDVQKVLKGGKEFAIEHGTTPHAMFRYVNFWGDKWLKYVDGHGEEHMATREKTSAKPPPRLVSAVATYRRLHPGPVVLENFVAFLKAERVEKLSGLWRVLKALPLVRQQDGDVTKPHPVPPIDPQHESPAARPPEPTDPDRMLGAASVAWSTVDATLLEELLPNLTERGAVQASGESGVSQPIAPSTSEELISLLTAGEQAVLDPFVLQHTPRHDAQPEARDAFGLTAEDWAAVEPEFPVAGAATAFPAGTVIPVEHVRNTNRKDASSNVSTLPSLPQLSREDIDAALGALAP